jgi:hypothetical protein
VIAYVCGIEHLGVCTIQGPVEQEFMILTVEESKAKCVELFDVCAQVMPDNTPRSTPFSLL